MLDRSQLRTASMYQVFTRNYSQEGTFKALEDDLGRIAEMGFDYLYLTPIHPIGELNRKGKLGSPYAIKDYYAVDVALGTLDEFDALVKEAHRQGLKVVLDIVINHTSRDHDFTKTHPEYYYQKDDHSFFNRFEEWSDIYDLNYTSPMLQKEMIDMLCYWAQRGIDGFRCDVASLVPVSFWRDAKQAVSAINPEMLWLAESSHGEFIAKMRARGYEVASDAELFEVFECCYNYDSHDILVETLRRNLSLTEYQKRLRQQEWQYRADYIKLNAIENHDQERVMHWTRDVLRSNQWLAFSWFLKGMAFAYAGQEFYETNHPSLFDKDPNQKMGNEINSGQLIKRLNQIKKMDFNREHSDYQVHVTEREYFRVEYFTPEKRVIGIFNVRLLADTIDIGVKDGIYTNLIDGLTFEVREGKIALSEVPLIFEERLD